MVQEPLVAHLGAQKDPFAEVPLCPYQERDVYPLILIRRGSVYPHRYFRVLEEFSAHVQTSAVVAEVVSEQEVIAPAAWSECVADCAEENRRSDPLHCPFCQVKGIGDDEENLHRPFPEEWVVPLLFYVGFYHQ